MRDALTVPLRMEAARRSTLSQCAVIRRSSGHPAMNGVNAGQFAAGPKTYSLWSARLGIRGAKWKPRRWAKAKT